MKLTKTDSVTWRKTGKVYMPGLKTVNKWPVQMRAFLGSNFIQLLRWACLTLVCVDMCMQLKINCRPFNNEMTMFISFVSNPDMRLQILPSARLDVSRPRIWSSRCVTSVEAVLMGRSWRVKFDYLIVPGVTTNVRPVLTNWQHVDAQTDLSWVNPCVALCWVRLGWM